MNMDKIVSMDLTINRKIITMIINMDRVANINTSTSMTMIIKKIINTNIAMTMEAKASV